MAEFEYGPRLYRQDTDRIPYLLATYNIGQAGLFRKEGICEFTKGGVDLPFRPNIPLPFTDESVLVFSRVLWMQDPDTFKLRIDGRGVDRKLKLVSQLSILEGLEMVVRTDTIRVIDQARSGIFKVGEAGTIFIDLAESKVGDLTLLNSPDVKFQINPPLLSREDLPPSRVVIDVRPPFFGQQLTVLLFRGLTTYGLPPDAVVLDQKGYLVERRVRRIMLNML